MFASYDEMRVKLCNTTQAVLLIVCHLCFVNVGSCYVAVTHVVVTTQQTK